MAAPPPPPRGLSLYDNLLDPNDPSPSATISSAPVLYNQAETSGNGPAPKKPLNPALKFQPIRRPQAKQAKPKAAFPKTIPKTTPTTAAAAAAAAPPQPPAQKHTLADWAATEEDEWMYGVGEKRQRGGRRKKKQQQQAQFQTDWDELYDPTRPTNVEEFLRSDEKVDEVREWKSLLYRHRKRRDESDLSDEEEEDTHPIPSNRFAPPPSYSSVPPPPPRSPPAAPPEDETAEDAYTRRLALSTGQPPRPTEPSPPPPPPPPQNNAIPPPPSTSATISRAPVRYVQQLPEPPSNAAAAAEEEEEEENDDTYSPPPSLGTGDNDTDAQPRSTRPGQAGFAHRLMAKYGWTKGTALGGSESGILNPLRVQVEKRRKKADADGGGWAEPGGKGKIVGGKRKEEAGRFGVMSEVILLQNMLENMPDLQAEIADGLGQEIGEECGEKYGRVERLYIDQENRRVFIQFTNQVSALRAVNELDGRVFNGNKIIPKFYDAESFERGIYGDL